MINWLTKPFKKNSSNFLPPEVWVDLHAHILPGVDDGPKTLDESLEVVETAAKMGITHIVATPHFSDLFPNAPERKESALALLRSSVKKNNINIKILSGWEVSFTDIHVNQIRFGENLRLTENSKYTLLELPNGVNKKAVMEGIFSLMVSGTKIIIAHPERNSLVQQDIGLVKELCLRDVKMQIDAESIVGINGHEAKETAFELLKNDKVHALSSDAHSLVGYKHYLDACKIINKNFGKNIIDFLLSEQPTLIAGI